MSICGLNIFIIGPTASGKSSLAIQLASELGLEICSVDAFQIYRGLDIGTGKVTRDEQDGIKHHLLDVVDPVEPFSVADYLGKAEHLINRSSRPFIWVGGTGLYYNALRKGLSPIPVTPAEIQEELSQWSLDELSSEVCKVDPKWAASADLKNPRRMIRALGVFRATGKPISEWQKIESRGPILEAKAFYLCPSSDELKSRIERRVFAMLENGWVEEVERLLKVNGWTASQSYQAIGYPEVSKLVQGRIGRQECLDEVTKQTWQYARRQRTWFRKEEGLVSLEIGRELEMIKAEIQ
ncbi:MAG: tRNA (adenosine(37)-N6)-dimethylallyltransferase MiaA [Verrucomicrobiota bacterium]